MEIGTYLEFLAFRLFIEQESIIPSKSLEKHYIKMKKYGAIDSFNIDEFAAYHTSFHQEIIMGSNNEQLIAILTKLNLRSSHMFHQSMNQQQLLRTQEVHEKIILFFNYKRW